MTKEYMIDGSVTGVGTLIRQLPYKTRTRLLRYETMLLDMALEKRAVNLLAKIKFTTATDELDVTLSDKNAQDQFNFRRLANR